MVRKAGLPPLFQLRVTSLQSPPRQRTVIPIEPSLCTRTRIDPSLSPPQLSLPPDVHPQCRPPEREACCFPLLGLMPLLASARSREDRKSTRLNSSHSQTSYAAFSLKS